jgi:hypothetical protein
MIVFLFSRSYTYHRVVETDESAAWFVLVLRKADQQSGIARNIMKAVRQKACMLGLRTAIFDCRNEAE